MKPEDFEKKMEGLSTPKSEAVPPKELRLAIVSAQRSAVMGIWFVIVPWFFLMCVIMKYIFHVNLGMIDTFEEMINVLDKNPKTWWIGPVMLIALPIVSIIMNTLAISHFKWESYTGSLIVSIRMRWLNLSVLVVSVGIVGTFFLYLITENCR